MTENDLQYTWMYEPFTPTSVNGKATPSRKYVEFWRSDSQLLEEASLRKQRGPIYVMGKTYVVNLCNKTIKPLFWVELPNVRRIIRVMNWFTKCSQGFFTPLVDEDALKLEHCYQDRQKQQQLKNGETLSVEISGGNTVIMEMNPKGEISMKMKSGCMVVRNRGDYQCSKEMEADMARCKLPVDSVFFLVHGIGEAIWNKTTVNVSSLRDIAEKFESKFLEMRLSEAKKTGKQPTGRTLVIPVNWFQTVQDKESQHQKDLNLVTLKSIPEIRDVANHVVLDVLFYTSSFHQHSIINEVSTSMNKAWDTLSEVWEGTYKIKFGIIGHSLGSVIGFDLLQIQGDKGLSALCEKDSSSPVPIEKLKFPVYLYVGCGSPLGMFLSIRGDIKKKDYKLPTCEHYLNVFYKSDPVAYRMEPRFESRFSQLDPEMVPVYTNSGSIKEMFTYAAIGLVKGLVGAVNPGEEDNKKKLENLDAMRKSANTFPPKEKLLDLIRGLKINAGCRVDFQLCGLKKEKISEHLAAFFSHTSYFDDEDFCMLVYGAFFGTS